MIFLKNLGLKIEKGTEDKFKINKWNSDICKNLL